MENLKYRVPEDLAKKIRDVVKTHDFNPSELIRRIIATCLIVDKIDSNRGSIIIKNGDIESPVRIIKDRSTVRKFLDGIELEADKKQSKLSVNLHGGLIKHVDRIARREKMSTNRFLGEMFSQGLTILEAQITPGITIIIREPDEPERELPNILSEKLDD